MGGSLICRILSEGAEAAQNAKELILSPHSEWYDVRKFLYDNGYTITDEDMLKEDGKYYVVIKAVPSKAGDNGKAGSQRSDASVALQDEQFRDELCYGPVPVSYTHLIPIYVGIDSLDVWSGQENFLLGADGKPTFIAGVPPDYFSATGQRWGNPIYDWDYMEKDGFKFWLNRLDYSSKLFDLSLIHISLQADRCNLHRPKVKVTAAFPD